MDNPPALLTVAETRFLSQLRDNFGSQNGWAICKTNPPSAGIQDLVNRGYCRLSRALCGPLRMPTGDVMVGLTEAGKAALGTAEAAQA